MDKKIRTLLIGESWTVHTVEAKGFDIFTFDYYDVGTKYISEALSTDEISFEHLPCHKVESDFPKTIDELCAYDVIFISDIGANTFLLPMKTFLQHKMTSNKLMMLQEYVKRGGGLCMVGGYLSFMGIEGKGKYYKSPVEEVLPVNFYPHDDRAEHPEGVNVTIDSNAHAIFKGMTGGISGVLGYNRAILKEGCRAIAEYDGDPFISIGEFGKGRSIAYATDCAPHWSPASFCESDDYKILFSNMAKWLAGKL
jgi:uncharacterized membrane protein